MPQQHDPEDQSAIETRPLGSQTAIPDSDAGIIGRRIGPYQITSEIGRGGMGAVYRALRVDGEFDAEVAIKVVRYGLNSQVFLHRFRTERQIQARLGHANIVRLIDGGTTTDGLIYLVMEYIEGQPLLEYCDSLKLPITERLKLFRKVCDAVSYAHQNLIVHRDLKPDNILVMADGTPKLLDFGIAKILDIAPEGAEVTMTKVLMGTPAYSSPEQVRGEPVSTATDIYSLGVVLYELLTGHRPYRLDFLGWEESARVICERDATRPSSQVVSKGSDRNETREISVARGTTVDGLRKRLAGDLDNIVAVALRKEPSRRYHSVDHFSEEIQNHLEGRPVKARGDSLFYKASKLIGRHKFATAAAALLTLLFLGASAVAVWKAHELSQRLDQDRKLATSFLVNVHESIARLPGSTPVRQTLLTNSLNYLNGLARYTGSDREMRRSLALAYERFADLQVGIEGAGLGRSAQALKTYETAKGIRESLAADAPNDPAVQYDLASNYLMGSYISGRVSNLRERADYDRRALVICKKLVADYPQSTDYRALLAKALVSSAYGFGLYARWNEATEYYRKALPIREALAAGSPPGSDAHRQLANVYYRLGVIETQSSHFTEALHDLPSALSIQTRMLMASPNDEQLRSEIASTHHFLGVALGQTGQISQALSHFHDAIALREATLAADENDQRTRSLLAGNYAEQAAVLLKAGQTNAALKSIQHALTFQRELVAIDRGGVPARLSLADYHSKLAAIYAASGKQREAGHNWELARVTYDELDREGHLKASDVIRDAERARAEAARYAQR